MKLFESFKSLNFLSGYKEKLGINTPADLLPKAKSLINQAFAMLDEEMKVAKTKLKDIPGTNYQLGLHHLKLGNLTDAIMRFKIVVYLTPEMADAYYNLARALLLKGETDSAKENLYKALSLKADFPEVNYVLSKIEHPEMIDSIPKNIIVEQLEWNSEKPQKSTEIRKGVDNFCITSILRNIHDKNPNLEVLDLGSNVGNRGLFLKRKEVIRRLVGVDINRKTNEDTAKNLFDGEAVYNNIVTSEVSEFLSTHKEKYDVIIAGNLFSYNRNLENIFSNIAGILKPGGVFSLIIEQNYATENYQFDSEKDCFIHSIGYFEEALKNSGFNIAEKNQKESDNLTFIIINANAIST